MTWLGRGPRAQDPSGNPGLPKALSAGQPMGGGVFLGSPISRPDPPTKSHPFRLPLPRPPGNDRDRVHGERLSGRLPEGACPPRLPRGPGGGKLVLGVGREREVSKHPQSSGPVDLGKGSEVQGRVSRVSPSDCLSAPQHMKVPLLLGLLCPAHGRRGGPPWRPRAPASWMAWCGGVEITGLPAPALPFICWVFGHRASPLWASVSPSAKWVRSHHSPTSLSGSL